MSNINLDKLQKLWNHATKNANEHEASTAALMFAKMIAKHNLKVHLYSGQAPATEQQIKAAIDKAYIQGQIEAKETYQRILERQKNEYYNEGYRDGQSNSYSKTDIDNAYQKGYRAGIKQGSIEKAPTQAIQQAPHSHALFSNTSTAATHPLITYINGTGTITVNSRLS
tara:strand:- start:213 stop:719 length:507 start_codon:yes stop_codon:yes gene_type:complete